MRRASGFQNYIFKGNGNLRCKLTNIFILQIYHKDGHIIQRQTVRKMIFINIGAAS